MRKHLIAACIALLVNKATAQTCGFVGNDAQRRASYESLIGFLDQTTLDQS